MTGEVTCLELMVKVAEETAEAAAAEAAAAAAAEVESARAAAEAAENAATAEAAAAAADAAIDTANEAAAALATIDAHTRAAFEQFDANGSGGIDASELVPALRLLGHPCSEEHARQVLDKYSSDGQVSGMLQSHPLPVGCAQRLLSNGYPHLSPPSRAHIRMCCF